MSCLDCGLPAVAVCTDCGAAICRAHAQVRPEHRVRVVAVMREVPVEPAARRVRCGLCDAAHHATLA